METGKEAKLMRIFVSSTDKFRHSPLYEVIVYAAKRYGMAGATVLKGVMGYGASSSISSVKFFELSEKLPMIIEIVDEAGKIDEFTEILLPYLEKIRYGCLITVEKANVTLYKKGRGTRRDER
jgi:PII-like signaling protein